MRQYCFVLMPFGNKPDSSGNIIDFDLIYEHLYKPAILKADLIPIRADEESLGGIIHKPMFERLMLCDFALADLTSLNANVYYELGIRHGLRPHKTILAFAKGSRLPFDVSLLRALPYKIDKFGSPCNIKEDIETLAIALEK